MGELVFWGLALAGAIAFIIYGAIITRNDIYVSDKKLKEWEE